MDIKGKLSVVFVSVLALATVVLRLYLVPNYPVQDDELISFRLMPTIVETGLPKIGDAFYWRALPAYYLMSIPLLFMEFSEYSARLVPIVCSGLILPVVYFIGLKCGSRLSGLVAAIFLSVSSYEGVMANFSRFYMPFQLFFCATVYLIMLYFPEKKSRYGTALFFMIFLCIGTHRLAFQISVFFILYLLFEKRYELLKSLMFVLSLFLIFAFIGLTWYWHPEKFVSGDMSLPVIMGALKNKWFFYDLMNRFIPFAWLLIFLGIYPSVKMKNRHWLCILFGFLTNFLVFTFVAPGDSERYIAHLFPLAVFLSAISLVWWVRTIVDGIVYRKNNFKSYAFLILIIIVLLPWNFNTLTSEQLFETVGWSIKYPNQKDAHDFIKSNIKDADILISVDPGMTGYYLNRENIYFLREKLNIKTLTYEPFNKKGNSNDYLIDSPMKLRKLLIEKKQRIWLYANRKIEKTISDEMDQLIRAAFKPVFSQDQTYVLLKP